MYFLLVHREKPNILQEIETIHSWLAALSFTHTPAVSLDSMQCVSLKRPPQYPHGLLVCVREEEKDKNTGKLDDGCLLLLTS